MRQSNNLFYMDMIPSELARPIADSLIPDRFDAPFPNVQDARALLARDPQATDTVRYERRRVD
jgi:hypothetical protein